MRSAILKGVLEIALENEPGDATHVQQIREAYATIDGSFKDVLAGHVTTRVAEALTVGHFATYFSRTISREAYDRYVFQQGMWRDYTFADSVPDYSTAERWRWSEVERPVRRDEKAEAQATYMYPSEVNIAVEDYAKEIDFSRRILINDDLGQFRQVGQKMGDSAKRFEDFFVSALYDNALTQGALVALGANYSGTGALTTANLAIAWNAFTQRVDGFGNPLNIMPRYLVIPPILVLAARTILESDRIAELATNAKNVMMGTLEIKVDPYIGFTLPNVPWYLFADPAAVPGVSVVRCTDASVSTNPRLYTLAPDKIPMTPTGALGTPSMELGSYLTGDISITVETCIGSRNDDLAGLVGVTDPNGIYYSSGTTP